MLRVRVRRKSQEAVGICGFELVCAEGGTLPAFTAGSHVDVHLPGGLVRQYSLCNDPAERHRYRIAVLREPNSRGGSTAMHDAVQEGDQLQISEPRNHFALQPAPQTLLLAGGIGVTPILSMARQLHASGAQFAMHYCTRSSDRTAFRQEIHDAPFADRVRIHHDDDSADRKLDLELVLRNSGGAHIYVCGPQGFIDWVRRSAVACGRAPEEIHVEYFGAAAAMPADDRPFDVVIASTGATVSVPAGKSVVQALRERGVEVLTSCEQGVCGTCATRVLEGECDHRDLYLTDAEKERNDQFLPCCSRARSPRLVLDL